MERRKTLCAVGAVALAAVLAGCGDVTDNEVPVDQVKKGSVHAGAAIHDPQLLVGEDGTYYLFVRHMAPEQIISSVLSDQKLRVMDRRACMDRSFFHLIHRHLIVRYIPAAGKHSCKRNRSDRAECFSSFHRKTFLSSSIAGTSSRSAFLRSFGSPSNSKVPRGQFCLF